jgi:hypothetical protein
MSDAVSPRVHSRMVGVAVGAASRLLAACLLAWAWFADRQWFERHGIWSCHESDCLKEWRTCVTSCNELAAIDRWRWLASGAGLLLLLLAPRLARWAGRRSPASLLGDLAGICGAAVLALGVCDLALRLKHPKPEVLGPAPATHPDARYGWVHDAPQTRVLQYGDKRVTYILDRDGNRVAPAGAIVDPNAPTILVAGESVALGFGVDYAESFPALVAADLRAQAINLSVTSYGNDQAYLRVHDELPRLARPVAVVTLVVPLQLLRNVDERRPRLIPGEGGDLREVPPLSLFWLTDPLRKLWRQVTDFHSREAIDIARAAFVATDREARARGAVPLFVLAHWGPPCMPDENGAPWIERALFAGLDLDALRVDLDPTFWEPATDHPDARAHRQLAAAIVQRLRSADSSRHRGAFSLAP